MSVLTYDDSGVDYSTPGEYIVTFSAMDDEGNVVSKDITLIIDEDTTDKDTTGWVNYFIVTNNTTFFVHSDSWVRRKIRVYIWKQWKKIKTRHKNLVSLRIDNSKAWEFTITRKGLWRISISLILDRTLTKK